MPDDARTRRALITSAKDALRDLRVELAVLNHRVGGRLQLRDLELDCLDLLVRHGPLTPSELRRRTGVHAATLTGVLSRLEDGRWIERTPAEHDKRSVVIRPQPHRMREIFQQYGGMNDALDEILGGYDAAQLGLIADFLNRASDAGRQETDRLE